MMMNKFKFLLFFACSGGVLFLLLSNASGAGNAQGVEQFGVPKTRSFGLSLNVKF